MFKLKKNIKKIIRIYNFYKNRYFDFRCKHNLVEADFFISLGGACRPAQWLNTYHLRVCSNPLDWMMCYDLKTVLMLFRNEFADFFKNRKYNKPELNSVNCRVEDLDTGMVAIHSFKVGVDDAVAYPRFLEIMQRRFLRMDYFIKKSSTVAFICNRNEPLDNFKNFLESMSKIYPLQSFTLINIYNDPAEESEEIFCINDKLKIIQYTFNDVFDEGDKDAKKEMIWLGNMRKWKEVCATLKLSAKFSYNDVFVDDLRQQ